MIINDVALKSKWVMTQSSHGGKEKARHALSSSMARASGINPMNMQTEQMRSTHLHCRNREHQTQQGQPRAMIDKLHNQR
eukprot:6188419-Pleurochrysis_carterae.AAC.9